MILRPINQTEVPEAARLLGCSMRDNPIDVRAFRGRDADHRGRALTRFYLPVLRGLFQRGSIVGAFDGAAMVGICGYAPPGRCQPGIIEKARIFPSVVWGNELATSLRVISWTGEWSRRDPSEPHWHLGPVAVAPAHQGGGVGSAMLSAFCAQMDGCGGVSYLETDKPENVRLYEKFGFEVIGQAQALEVPNWFMSRRPQGTPAAS